MAKRRPNGAGTITRRGDGRYQGAVYATTASGQRKRVFVYGKTYDDVAEKIAKLQVLLPLRGLADDQVSAAVHEALQRREFLIDAALQLSGI